MKNIAFGALAGDYLAHLRERNYAVSTIRGYMGILHVFLDYLAVAGVSDIRAVTRQTVWQYACATVACGHAAHTVLAKFQTVQAFFRWLRRTDRILGDPTVILPDVIEEERLPRVVMTRDEVNLILAQPVLTRRLGYRDRAILETLYSTAVRLSELLRLRIADLDLVAGFVRVVQGKYRKDRIVPLGKVAAGFVREYLRAVRPRLARPETGNEVFLSQEGTPLSAGRLQRIVQRYARAAHLTKNVSCHTFRHTCATEMLRGGSSLRHVQEMLGHADIGTTAIYTRVLPLDLLEAHARCHPRSRRRAEPIAAAPTGKKVRLYHIPGPHKPSRPKIVRPPITLEDLAATHGRTHPRALEEAQAAPAVPSVDVAVFIRGRRRNPSIEGRGVV